MKRRTRWRNGRYGYAWIGLASEGNDEVRRALGHWVKGGIKTTGPINGQSWAEVLSVEEQRIPTFRLDIGAPVLYATRLGSRSQFSREY